MYLGNFVRNSSYLAYKPSKPFVLLKKKFCCHHRLKGLRWEGTYSLWVFVWRAGLGIHNLKWLTRHTSMRKRNQEIYVYIKCSSCYHGWTYLILWDTQLVSNWDQAKYEKLEHCSDKNMRALLCRQGRWGREEQAKIY